MPDPTRVVICNTSPLFYLHRINQLDLLRALYGGLIVPEAVAAELHAGAQLGEDVPDLQSLPWVSQRTVRVPAMLRSVTDLGEGEAQVLALAMETPESLAILDDRLARQLALSNHVQHTGTIGVLLRAKNNGFIPRISPLLDAMQSAGFRLSDRVKSNALKLSGE